MIMQVMQDDQQVAKELLFKKCRFVNCYKRKFFDHKSNLH